jgi:hypothetical protein
MERPAFTPALCVAFRALRFITRSPKKSAETAVVPEHPSSRFVVGPGNEHTGGITYD